MIIGLSGRIGSGKDTVADYLVKQHSFKRYSYAGVVKDCLSLIFGWDRELLNGYTVESRNFREQPDVWWSKRLGIENFSPRFAMQHIATDVLRKHFRDEIWVASMENKLKNETQNCVVTDCRFPNEIRGIKQSGGIVVRVRRGPDPAWYEHAENYNLGPTKLGWAIGKDQLEKAGVHPSEYSWIGSKFDFVLDNNGTLDQLYQQINDLVRDLQDAKVGLVE